MTDTDTKALVAAAVEAEAVGSDSSPISMAEFLESTPPNQDVDILDVGSRDRDFGARGWALNTPQILLHCPNENCNGNRFFRNIDGKTPSIEGRRQNEFLIYRCWNCQRNSKTFSIIAIRKEVGSNSGFCRKLGEYPPFGPPTPSRLLGLIGPDRDLFLKGRRCENQGLGIGAFTYYRRVVENQKARIFDEVIKVARKLAAPEDDIAELEGAKNEIQFKKSLSMVKNGMPQALLISGHNPMALLHRALSEGVHNKNDEECLELASSIRVVLSEFSDRLGQALKDEVELKHAIGRLLGSNNHDDIK